MSATKNYEYLAVEHEHHKSNASEKITFNPAVPKPNATPGWEMVGIVPFTKFVSILYWRRELP